MDNQNKTINKIERKNFFKKIGTGMIGAFILSSIPFAKVFSNRESTSNVKVKINPLAVSRKSRGVKNG